MKTGAPIIAVKIPIGTSVGGTNVRLTPSASSSKIPPARKERGRIK